MRLSPRARCKRASRPERDVQELSGRTAGGTAGQSRTVRRQPGPQAASGIIRRNSWDRSRSVGCGKRAGAVGLPWGRSNHGGSVAVHDPEHNSWIAPADRVETKGPSNRASGLPYLSNPRPPERPGGRFAGALPVLRKILRRPVASGRHRKTPQTVVLPRGRPAAVALRDRRAVPLDPSQLDARQAPADPSHRPVRTGGRGALLRALRQPDLVLLHPALPLSADQRAAAAPRHVRDGAPDIGRHRIRVASVRIRHYHSAHHRLGTARGDERHPDPRLRRGAPGIGERTGRARRTRSR